MKLALLRFALAAWLVACGAGLSGSETASGESAATIEARKCAACHRPPDPGVRKRDYLETALSRHRNRVHLRAEQWRAILDYLAVRPSSATPAQVVR